MVLLTERRSSAYAIACVEGSVMCRRWIVRALSSMSYTAFHPKGLATSPCETAHSAGNRTSVDPSAWRRERPFWPALS